MALFEPTIAFTLPWEGGYVNDPTDPGGETNFGISKRAFPNVDIKNLTLEGAKALYLDKYWNANLAALLDQNVANKIFDMTVNFGPTEGLVLLENALRQMGWASSMNGKWTDLAVTQVNKSHPGDLIIELRLQSVLFYDAIVAKNPAKATFRKGWLRRACA